MKQILLVLFALSLSACQKSNDLPIAKTVDKLVYLDVKSVVFDYWQEVNTPIKVSTKTESEVYYESYLSSAKEIFIDIADPDESALDYTNQVFASDLEAIQNYDDIDATLILANVQNIGSNERATYSSFITAIEAQDTKSLIDITDAVIHKLNNNEYETNEHNRMVFLLANIEAIQTSQFPNISLEKKDCGSAAGWGALGGAIVGGLTGLAKGCITGVFWGFNPGSAAAGCMIGMIGGIIGGATSGAASGALSCAIQN